MVPDALPPLDTESTDDGVHYPVSDDMGESGLQHFVVHPLLSLLKEFFAARGRPALVAGNQFFYYKRGDPRACVAPDAYVIDDCSVSIADVGSWKLWERDGKVPTLAIEVVSEAFKKDYAERMVERYEQLGVRELVRYDPEYALRGVRRLLSHFVRDERGRLVAQEHPRDRVRLQAYDVWLVQQPDRSLRIGLGPMGTTLWPTLAERAGMAAAEAAARAEEAAAAAAEVEGLRAELARLRGG
jgi:Uma2 family endonuclease